MVVQRPQELQFTFNSSLFSFGERAFWQGFQNQVGVVDAEVIDIPAAHVAINHVLTFVNESAARPVNNPGFVAECFADSQQVAPINRNVLLIDINIGDGGINTLACC